MTGRTDMAASTWMPDIGRDDDAPIVGSMNTGQQGTPDQWPARAGTGYARAARRSLVAVLLVLIGIEFVVAVAHPLGAFRHLGGDYSLYMDAARRWLAGGSFYQSWQFAPYIISFMPGDIGTTAILYPPYALALFVPFALLPAVLWWVIPIGIISYGLYPVSGWRLVALLAAIAAPVTWFTIANGNPGLWAAAFLVAGTRWAVFVLLKPTLAPFALVGIRSRGWWVGAVVLVILSVVMWPLTLEYIAVLRNAHGPEASPLYSLTSYLPLGLLWIAGHKETPALSLDKGAESGRFGRGVRAGRPACQAPRGMRPWVPSP